MSKKVQQFIIISLFVIVTTTFSYASNFEESDNIPLNCITLNQSGRSEWFKDFFLQIDASPSHRLFCIWFGGDRKAYTQDIYIGGSPEESEKWFRAAEDMLDGFKKSGVENRFLFEIVVDKETYNTQQTNFSFLQNTYADCFKVTFITDIQIPDIQEVLTHSEDGNPALASDALRLWYLKDSNYGVNTYIDIDTFIDKVDNLGRYTDFKVFGHEVEEGYVYSNAGKSGGFSNDYLIEKNALENAIFKLKNKGLENFEKNKFLFSYYKNRAQFILNEDLEEGYNQYLENLEDTFLYFLGDGEACYYNLHTAIMDTFGPYLWANNQGSRLSPLRDENPSACVWKEGNKVPMGPRGKYSNTKTLKELQWLKNLRINNSGRIQADQFLKNIVKLNFMGLDYVYYSKFDDKEKFIIRFKEEMTLLWNELSLSTVHDIHLKEILGLSGGIYHVVKELDEQMWAKFYGE